jgi:hypothetical protein
LVAALSITANIVVPPLIGGSLHSHWIHSEAGAE